MEAGAEWELKLLEELLQGQDLTKQLQIQLDSSSPPGLREALVHNILDSYARVFSLLQTSNLERQPHSTPGQNSRNESPSGSPRSENSGRDFKDYDRRDMCKKRKMLPKWTEQVRVGTGTGFEGPFEDGYSWRKYGQKDILGAKYPRGYYRCTHRNTQGCQATKQVQRSDEDPSIFEVSYRGKHTCQQGAHLIPNAEQQTVATTEQPQHQPGMHLDFQNGLRVKTEDLDSRELERIPSFSFRSPSNNYTTNDIFSTSQHPDNSLMGSFSPALLSPATSESNYFSLSPCQMNSGGGCPNLPTLECDSTEIVSSIRPNSPLVEFHRDFSLEPLEFDPNFPIDAFFS